MHLDAIVIPTDERVEKISVYKFITISRPRRALGMIFYASSAVERVEKKKYQKKTDPTAPREGKALELTEKMSLKIFRIYLSRCNLE